MMFRKFRLLMFHQVFVIITSFKRLSMEFLQHLYKLLCLVTVTVAKLLFFLVSLTIEKCLCHSHISWKTDGGRAMSTAGHNPFSNLLMFYFCPFYHRLHSQYTNKYWFNVKSIPTVTINIKLTPSVCCFSCLNRWTDLKECNIILWY